MQPCRRRETPLDLLRNSRDPTPPRIALSWQGAARRLHSPHITSLARGAPPPWICSPCVCSPRRGMAHRLHSPRLASLGTWCGASKNIGRDGRVDSRQRGAACGLPPVRSVRGIHPAGSGAPNPQPAPRLRCPRRASLCHGSGPRLLRIAGWGKVTGEREAKRQKRTAHRM